MTSVSSSSYSLDVLDAAWDVIQERGMETLTYFKSTHRRGPHRERDAIGLREREFPPHEKESFFQTELSEGLQTKPSPTDIHQTPSQEAIESPLHEGSLHEDDVALYLESLLPPEDESPAFDPEVVVGEMVEMYFMYQHFVLLIVINFISLIFLEIRS